MPGAGNLEEEANMKPVEKLNVNRLRVQFDMQKLEEMVRKINELVDRVTILEKPFVPGKCDEKDGG